MKAPAFQFYPGDWMKDPALRAVSLAARGLWMDLLCLMWESPIRGRLLHGAGGPITVDQLGRICGCPGGQAKHLVAELERCGVCSRGQDGAMESRRMMRDEALRKVRAEGGFLGGNPTLKVTPKVRGKVGDKVNLPPNHAPTFNPTPSSSSSSSSSDKVNLPVPSLGKKEDLDETWRDQIWKRFSAAYPKQGHLNPERDTRLFLSLIETEVDGEALLAGLDKWKKSERWREGYVLDAKTFIGDRVWQTEPPEDRPKRGRRSAMEGM